ncbi:MAG: hypothetical protein E7Z88_03420 [Cyanobacteria bacterium SIG27]|nr:hypothetical protein [Cyanobacteria bacterium SIG27]
MKINPLKQSLYLKPTFKSNNKINEEKNALNSFSLNSNPIAQLNKAQIAFGAMKKSQFNGIDLIMIERTKAPIQSFSTNQDLQSYCQKILDENYLGEKNLSRLTNSIDDEAQSHKRAILNSWIKYVTKENDAYTPAIALFILSSITKNLNQDTNYLPPTLNRGVLASTIAEIVEQTRKNRKFNPNFEKTYKNNIQKSIFEKETQLDPSLTGWVKIPSSKNDPNNFEANVLKLQTLSHNSWCTKTYNARPYLKQGDFWVYLEEGKPKLGVRFNKKEIVEIQGEKNNSEIPVNYHQIIHSFIDENNFSVSFNMHEAMNRLDEKKEALDEIISKIGQGAIEQKDWEKILPAFGIEVKKDENGMLILSRYFQISKNNISLEDLGLKDQDIFKNVIKIDGDAYFTRSDVENLGSLEEITGHAVFDFSKITTLANLRRIGGHAHFIHECNVESLGNLEYIGKSANFADVPLTSLGNLKEVGGDLAIQANSKIESLGELRKIGHGLDVKNEALESLGKLEEIGGSLRLTGSEVVDLGRLKRIEGNALFSIDLEDMGELEYIGGWARFNGTEIKSLKNLRTIGAWVDFEYCEVQDLGKLEHIGGRVRLGGGYLVEDDFKNIQHGEFTHV